MRPLRTAEVVEEPEVVTSGPCVSHDARTRVLRERPGDSVRWELWLREPSPALAGLVVGLWAGDADSSFARHRALPNGELSLMFNLGHPQRVVEGGGGAELLRAAFISGLHEAPLDFESVVRHPRAVAVRLRPLGAFALFGGLPLVELANRVVDLESVLGRMADVEPLRQRLIGTAHLGSALDLLEGWLEGLLLAGPSAHPVTRAALDRLSRTGGDVRVEALARELGVSPRHLNGLFHREVGVSAKGLARILRFERAQDRLAATESPDLADVAAECGYYDQSHLNRDFRDLAGLTPTEYLVGLFQAPGWRELHGR